MSAFTYKVTMSFKSEPNTQACSEKLHITVRDKDGKVLVDRDA